MQMILAIKTLWNDGILEYSLILPMNPLFHGSTLPVFQIKLYIAQKREEWED